MRNVLRHLANPVNGRLKYSGLAGQPLEREEHSTVPLIGDTMVPTSVMAIGADGLRFFIVYMVLSRLPGGIVPPESTCTTS